MRKIDFPLICDVLFYTVCTWFLAMGILRFYRTPMWLAIFAASLIALAIGGVSFLLIYTRRKKRALTKAERERREKLMLHLALERPKNVLEALSRAFEMDEKKVRIEGNQLTVDGEVRIVFFTMQPVSADAVANMLRAHGGEQFGLICNELSPEAEKLLRSFGKSVLRGDEVFALFERTDTTPSPLICGDIPRPKLKVRLHRTFSKRNARPFFVSGILLVIMSLFTFFPLYYLISGSILLFTAIAVRLLGFA